ncbi:MAG: hypothetical protein Q8781_02100, partial [Candidatus Phytoplasma stylosanthis]|uniref:hypothetical protein n=1 Tax=Candidatus Phytoplasma stylosanthis TaxID=2798314 RepID=UPI00293B37FF
ALVSSKDYGSLILKVHFHLKSHTSPSQSTLSLKDVLTQTDLGFLKKINKEEIINKIKKLNPNLKVDNLVVEILLEENKANIKSNDFNGKVDVYYDSDKNIIEKKDEIDKFQIFTFFIIFIFTFFLLIILILSAVKK